MRDVVGVGVGVDFFRKSCGSDGCYFLYNLREKSGV